MSSVKACEGKACEGKACEGKATFFLNETLTSLVLLKRWERDHDILIEKSEIESRKW